MLTAYLRLGIDSHDGILAKTGCILAVNNDRPGKDGTDGIGLKGNRMLLPMNQIGRRSVRPVHRTPSGTKRIMLIIEMP